MADTVTTTYYGWAKPTGGAWSRIDATAAQSKAACYDALMRETELKGGWQGGDLMVLPEGRTPLQEQAAYHDRMMRPRR